MFYSATDISVSYGDKTVLANVSLSLERRERVALVGANGTGKSTLLKVLAKEEDGGGRIVHDKEASLYLLPQSPVFTEDTVKKEMEVWNAGRKVPAEPYELAAVLTSLQLEDGPIANLSGGQQKRLALAKALVSEADILLLDEPTNHLDTDMMEWLERQLVKSGKTILLVSHDRMFLEAVCTRIIELEDGKLYNHAGGYETYLEDVAVRKETEAKNRQALENLYRKELAWVRAGVQARSTKSKSRLDNFEKLRSQRKPNREKSLELAAPSTRLGKKVGQWEDLAFGYDRPLFTNFSCVLKRTDRIGIAGPNGCGKTTLLNVLAQRIVPDCGTVEWGPTVRIGWFGQGEQAEDLSMRVLDYVEETAAAVKWKDGVLTAAQMLEKFLVPKDLHSLPLSRLSGGERRRVYLLRVLMQAPNVLFLDEPTNDLDLPTLAVLEDYLDAFAGVVIMVSHDRVFMDRVCETLYAFEDGSLVPYLGGYTEYRQKVQEKQKERQKKPAVKRVRTGLSSRERNELNALPAVLEDLESQIEAINGKMETEPDYKIQLELSQKREELEQELEEKTERWMELEEKKAS